MIESILNFFRNLGAVRAGALVAAGVVILLTLWWFITGGSSSSMGILYTNLELVDSGKIINALETRKIPYKLEAGGTVIKVPEEQILQMRVALAQEGLPAHGTTIGYEIFDREESLGTTTFQQNVKMLRALEGELGRTINSFAQIDKARVHLVIPQRELFSKERQEPRASVILKLYPYRNLNKAEINAISHLIATAVPNLDIKNVTIVDTNGNSLKLGSEHYEQDNKISQEEEYRIAYENRLRKIIEDILAQAVGTNKVKAQVHADINFDRFVNNSELYEPDKSVVRSTQRTESKERTPTANSEDIDISVVNNLPGMENEGQEPSNIATKDKIDEIINYEVSKTNQNYISNAVVVKRLSIAVLVDGVYTNNSETNQLQYQPRSQEELNAIERLVKAAVGFDETRQDVIQISNMQFSSSNSGSGELLDSSDLSLEAGPDESLQAIILIIALIIILLVVIRIVLKNSVSEPKNWEPNLSASALAKKLVLQEEALSQQDRDNIRNNVHFKNSDKIVQDKPEDALKVLRKWMTGNK